MADYGGGLDALAVGMASASVASAPTLVGLQLATESSVFADSRPWPYGAVGLLSSAIPYALDRPVQARIGRTRFALLSALLPATAAAVGTVLLAQRPSVLDAAGIVLVTLALLVSAGDRRFPTSTRCSTRGNAGAPKRYVKCVEQEGGDDAPIAALDCDGDGPWKVADAGGTVLGELLAGIPDPSRKPVMAEWALSPTWYSTRSLIVRGSAWLQSVSRSGFQSRSDGGQALAQF